MGRCLFCVHFLVVGLPHPRIRPKDISGHGPKAGVAKSQRLEEVQTSGTLTILRITCSIMTARFGLDPFPFLFRPRPVSCFANVFFAGF